MIFLKFAISVLFLCFYVKAKPDVSHITQDDAQRVIQTIENRGTFQSLDESEVLHVDPELFNQVKYTIEKNQRGFISVDSPILATRAIELKLEDPLILNENYDAEVAECSRECQTQCPNKYQKFVKKT